MIIAAIIPAAATTLASARFIAPNENITMSKNNDNNCHVMSKMTRIATPKTMD